MASLRPIEVMCPECRRPIVIPLIAGPVESDGTLAYVNVRADETAIENHRCKETGDWQSARERKPDEGGKR